MIVSRLRRADHEGAAARVRGRDEPPDPAPDGGLRRLRPTEPRTGDADAEITEADFVAVPSTELGARRRPSTSTRSGCGPTRHGSGGVLGRRDDASGSDEPDDGSGSSSRPADRATSRCTSTTWRRRGPSSRRRASSSSARPSTPGVCYMAFFRDPDGNALMLHQRYAPRDELSCSSATGRCRCRRRRTSTGASPTSPGFDPDSFAADGATEIAAPPTLLEIDAAGFARVGEAGHRDRARARGRPLRARSRTTTRCCTRSSAGTRSSPRTTPRCGSTACSCTSRRASCSSSRSTCGSRTRSRAARSSGGCSSSPSRRAGFTVIEEYVSSSPELERLLERGRRDRRRAGREGRVRLGAEPLPRDVALRLAPRAGRARRRARLGRGRLRLGEGQGADPERPRRAVARPRASPARTSPTARSTSTTTRSRSTSRPTRPPTSPSRARCATRRARSGAG